MGGAVGGETWMGDGFRVSEVLFAAVFRTLRIADRNLS